MVSFLTKKRKGSPTKFTITMESDANHQIIHITSGGEKIPEDLQEFLENKHDFEPRSLDLNLFTAKLLLTRYNAVIKCERNETTSENRCILIFAKS